jgi:carboxyl-terminal processing protease
MVPLGRIVAKRLLKIVAATILVLLMALAAFVVYHRLVASSTAQKELGQLSLLLEAMEEVQQHYVDAVDSKVLVQNALKGMLAALDPHSAYLAPDDFREMSVEISGAFSGVGIELNKEDGRLLVVAPIDDTPAHRAGIRSGDQIWKIDDTFTRNLSLTEAVKRMRGPKGTRVTLTIVRSGMSRPRVVSLVRDVIQIKSLRARLLEAGFGYVRISHFQERTEDEFVRTLGELRRQNGGPLQGLVLDLRNNPGGLLEQAVAVANRFVGDRPDNSVIVSTRGRQQGEDVVYRATLGEKEPSYPLVILVNSGSASASEIVAGALQDHRRAIIMGEQTFGKGSVQSILQLPGGAGIKLTTARYYTPAGRSIQARGIVPDIQVGQLETNGTVADERHPVVREADLDGHLPGDGEPAPGTPGVGSAGKGAKVPAAARLPEDYQLFRALELLKGLKATAGYGRKGA